MLQFVSSVCLCQMRVFCGGKSKKQILVSRLRDGFRIQRIVKKNLSSAIISPLFVINVLIMVAKQTEIRSDKTRKEFLCKKKREVFA